MNTTSPLSHGPVAPDPESVSGIEVSRARYRDLYERAPVGYWEVGADGVILESNLTSCDLLGVPGGSPTGLPMAQFVTPEDRELLVLRFAELVATGAAQMCDVQMLRGDGTRRWFEVRMVSAASEGAPPSFRLTLSEADQRKRVEARLLGLSRAIEQGPVSIVITSLEGNIEYVNSRFEEVTGYTTAEAIGQNPRILKSGITPQATYEDLWRTISAGIDWHGELCNRRKDGGVFWEYAAICQLKDGAGRPSQYIAVKEDITARKRLEEAMNLSIHEKEALLKEIHHRVKNNLQVISSLLRLEARRSDATAAQGVLTDMQGRIRAMALLHETLYRSGNFGSVDLAAYLGHVAQQAFQAQGVHPGDVELLLSLSPTPVELDQAIPCGLIINELVSNALLHGFPNGRRGRIWVRVQQEGVGGARLAVADTGIGLPPDLDVRRAESLGLQLVSDLVLQIDGRLDVHSEGGASFDLVFPPQRAHAVPAGVHPVPVHPVP